MSKSLSSHNNNIHHHHQMRNRDSNNNNNNSHQFIGHHHHDATDFDIPISGGSSNALSSLGGTNNNTNVSSAQNNTNSNNTLLTSGGTHHRSGSANTMMQLLSSKNNNNNNSSSLSPGNANSNNNNPIVIDQLEFKDIYRQFFSNLPLAFFHAISLLVTFFLLFIALADRSAMQKTWYLLLEGIMVSFFAFEITSRYMLSRSVFGSYFKNKTNLVEAVVCAVCVLMFVFLLFSRKFSSNSGVMEQNLPHAKQQKEREEAEHELVVVVRFAAQLFRGVLYLRNVARARREGGDNDNNGGRISLMHSVSGGGGATSSLV